MAIAILLASLGPVYRSRLSALAVVGPGAVLAEIVFIQQLLLHGPQTRCQRHGVEVHKSALLQHHGVVDCVEGVRAPGEGSVAVDQNGGNLHGVNVPLLKGLDDDIAGLQLIAPGDLRPGHLPCAGDLAVKIVAVRCAKCRNTHALLRHSGGPAGMRMYVQRP